MSLELRTLDDFSGLNLQDTPAKIGGTQMTEARDVIPGDVHGRARRRGGYTHRQPETSSGSREIVALGNYAYQRESRAILSLEVDDDFTRLRFMDDNQAPVTVFRHTNTSPKRGRFHTGGWTPAAKTDESGNARLNAALVANSAFSGTLVVQTTGAFPTPKPNQFAGSFTSGGVTFYWRFTVWTAGSGSFETVGGSTITVSEQGSGGTFDTAATVGPFTLAAGLGGQPQDLFWSLLGDSHNFRVEDGKFTDFVRLSTPRSGAITHIDGMGNNAFVFKEDGIHTFLVTSDPTKWDVRQRVNVGCTHAESIAPWGEGFIFANREGVWRTDGMEAYSISDRDIGDFYRALMSGVPFFNRNWSLCGDVYQDFYILSIVDSDGSYVRTLCCHLPTQSWSEFNNMQLSATCASENGFSLYGAVNTAAGTDHIVDLGRVFRSVRNVDPYDRGYASFDAESDTYPSLSLTTVRLTMEDDVRLAHYKQLQIDYEAEGGTLSVGTILGLDPDATPSALSLDVLPASSTQTRQRRRFSQASHGFAVHIQEATRCERVVIAGIEIGMRPMRPGRFNPPA